MRRIHPLAGVLAVTLTLGCDSQLPSDNPAPAVNSDRAQAIVDGNHSGGLSYFRFLPPVVASAGTLPTVNDKKLAPELRICELANGQCANEIWSFSLARKQPANRTLNVSKDGFEASWQTAASNLDATKTYRAQAMLDGHVFGFIDIDVVNSAAELAGVDKANFLGVVRGSTVPLNFWIQTGIFTQITGKTGGLAGANGGLAKVDVAKGSTGDIHVGIMAGTPPTVPGAIVVPNTYYVFMFDGQTFSKPAMLTLRVDPKWVPSTIRRQDVKVLRFADGRWSEVPGSINEIDKKMQVSAPISGFAAYALGVITSQPQPIVDVTLNQQQPLLGSPVSGVQRLRGAAAQTSCSNTLRQQAVATPQLWVGPTSLPITNGACPFEGFITRVGAGYNIQAVVDGVTGYSAAFDVAVPAGTQLLVDVAAGNYFTGSAVPTSSISIVARNGAGQPLPFVDVDLTVTGGNLQLGGAPVTSYSGRTDAGGVLTLPAGNWILAATPQTNTVRVTLPNTSVVGTDDVVTTSGAPQTLSAAPMPASVLVNTPGSIEVVALDAQGNPASINQSFSAVLNGPNGSSSLGSVMSANGRATFNYNFAQPGYNHTITFSSTGLTAHTTNAFTIAQIPSVPDYSVQNPQSTSLDLVGSHGPVFGSNIRLDVEVVRVGAVGEAPRTFEIPASATPANFTNVIDALNPNASYDVRVRACIEEGCSAYGPAVRGLTRPAVVTNVAASEITHNHAAIMWTAVAGPPVDYNTLETTAGEAQIVCTTSQARCEVNGLSALTEYAYSVEACNASGCGPRSAPITLTTLQTPAPPRTPNFQFVSATQTSLTFNIENVLFNGANPRLEMRSATSPGGTSVLVQSAVPTGGQWTLMLRSSLPAGTLFDVTVRACDDNGCSPFSLNTLQPTLQPAPQNVSVTNLSHAGATVNWSAQSIPNGAPHYFQVWLAAGSGPLQLVNSTAGTSMNLTLAAATAYTAEVRACNASGCSATQTTITTPATPTLPLGPERVQINAQAFTGITLGWTDRSNNEDGFRILRSSPGTPGFVVVGTVGPNTQSFVDSNNLVQNVSVLYRVDAFNAAGSATSSNQVSTFVPVGQTTAIAPYGAILSQIGTNGAASPGRPGVRLINPNGTNAIGVPVTFTITSATSSFTALVPRTTTVTVNTNTGGVAFAPLWILETGTSTVAATATGFGQVVFTGIVN